MALNTPGSYLIFDKELRLHCICNKPYNPDTTMFWCDKCKIWEHEKCLADAIRKDYLKSNPSSGNQKKPRKSLGKNIDITIATDDTTGEVTAYINDKDRKVKKESRGGTDERVKEEGSVKVDLSGDKSSIAVKCLKCGTQLK